MSSLVAKRRTIRHLLDRRNPADGRAAYYAFEHPDFKTNLFPYHPDRARAVGYVCLSRTGLDLFRPLVTLRLPWADPETCQALLQHALPPNQSVIMSTPTRYMPLIQALFEIQSEQTLHFLTLDVAQFKPMINVLVTSEMTPNGSPRFVIKRDGDLMAAASLNWESQTFGEISVETHPHYRRQGWGQSVTAALCNHLLQSGRTPLYVVAADNQASQQLARGLGFVDTEHREQFIEASLR